MSDQWLDAARPVIEKAWYGSAPNASFFQKMEAISRVYQSFCRHKAMDYKAEEEDARKQLSSTSVALQANPNDPLVQDSHGKVRFHLQEIETRKVAGRRIRARIRWKLRGDLVSSEFFKALREKPASSAITCLRNSQGEEVKDQDGLKQICSDFYSKLYTAEPESSDNLEAMDEFLSLLPDSVPQEAKISLSKPITEPELKLALDDMAPHKSPGPDGFITEFYLKYWAMIGHEFTTMIHQSIARGALPLGMNRGSIILLHKGGPREELSNWRPISLLNVAYKILAKALQMRLQPILVEVISTDQSAFIPTRYILDNILLLQETISWAKESKQDAILLKLDFKKAYDTVHLPFLFRTLETMGVPQGFVNLVKLLFVNAEALVCLNGSVVYSDVTWGFPVWMS